MEKKSAIDLIQQDFSRIKAEKQKFSERVRDLEEEGKTYIRELLKQIRAGSGPVIAKTPKVPKSQNRIRAIPENDEVDDDSTSNSIPNSSSSVLEVSDTRPSRARRGASIKAADNIKKQQSITLATKLRRPSKITDESLSNKIIKESRSKRPKTSFGSSDEEDTRPTKQIKVDKKKGPSKSKKAISTDSEVDATFDAEDVTVSGASKKQSLKRKLDDENKDPDSTLTSEKSVHESPKSGPAAKKAHYSSSWANNQEKTSKYVNTMDKISESPTSGKQSDQSARRSTRSSATSVYNTQSAPANKRTIINETVDMSNADETLASMYEDAVCKPLPIMNSTPNANSTVTLNKMMNVTVLIEPLSSKKVMDETVTIKKSMFKEPTSTKKINETRKVQDDKAVDPQDAIKRSSRSQRAVEQKKRIPALNELITDDESSPERKNRHSMQRRSNRINNSNSVVSDDDDDEIHRTPIQNKQKESKLLSAVKSAYKTPALFSPYAKDSVKKRVEAFEQVATSPNKAEAKTSGRVTRTKTRALAAASETPSQAVAQKLARKSLAKAKKISLAKRHKEFDDAKENDNTNIPKYKKTSSLEMSAQKPQPKTTPLGKSRLLQVPNSATKNQFATPSNAQIMNSHSKALTASRGNIVTHVDSFIQPPKSVSKPDKASEERKRRAYDEDVKRKRDELLRARAEEKKRIREEKEMKNKLAREAKEKQEQEKRLKAEREREEKAKLAQQMQEKQKEELERKRIIQLQRAQEKEERRRQEEMLRMQRLQEQEEQERLLAEQKRREQELEKRKQAELRHQMVEMKLKSQMEKAALQAKQAKALAAQKQAINNYKMDSDPDEEDTDDECRPKHQIPQWALKNVRQAQLAMQQYVPMSSVLRFFDAKKCTPDLRDLFKGIDPKKLKRTSSAIWKTPPRFSMMDQSIIKD